MTQFDPQSLEGATVYGSDNEKIGKITGVYLDNQTGNPEWAAVKTGFLGGHVTLVPLAVAQGGEGELRVPFGKEQVRSAPHHDPDAELSVDAERQLFEHYGVPYGGETVTAQPGQFQGETGGQAGQETAQRGQTGHDTSGPNTDDAMTRSEEQLRVGKEQVEAGRARLRKYVTTEQVTQTVPVTREEVRIEREPVTEENLGQATSGPEISEEEHEIVLHEERPVVAKETVPVERVRLATDTVTEERPVEETVRKEHIETEGAEGAAGRRQS